MSRYDYRDPGQDPAYCDPLSDPPESDVPNCETCGEPANEAIWAANGQYAFCSDKCRDDYYKALEEL
jgi:hypothetical protein